MTIEFNDELEGIWYVQVEPEADFLAGLSVHADGTVKVQYRFRYYHDDDPWSQQDEKHWYTITGDGPASRGIGMVRSIIEQTFPKDFSRYELLREGRSTKDFIDEFTKAPFAHAKTIMKSDESP